MLRLALGVLSLVAFALAVSLAHSWVKQSGDEPVRLTLSGTGEGADAPPPALVEAAETLGLEITVEQAAALYESGASFLDARLPAEFEAGHVEGAFFLTAEMVGTSTPEVLEFLSRADPVVIYCGGGDCESSHNLAIMLEPLGFARLHIMVDGYPAWAGAGLPTGLGSDPIGEPAPGR